MVNPSDLAATGPGLTVSDRPVRSISVPGTTSATRKKMKSAIASCRPIPPTVFKYTPFDLMSEVKSATRSYNRREDREIPRIRKVQEQQPVTLSLADPEFYDPSPTDETVRKIELRLEELKAPGFVQKKGSLIKPMLLPEDSVVTRRPNPADFRLRQLGWEIDDRQEMLRTGSYKALKNPKGKQPPCGITISKEDGLDVILYDEYPQATTMSEYLERYFARSRKTVREIGMGKDPRFVHEKDAGFDYRESLLRQEIAMGKRKA